MSPAEQLLLPTKVLQHNFRLRLVRPQHGLGWQAICPRIHNLFPDVARRQTQNENTYMCTNTRLLLVVHGLGWMFQ